MPRPDDLRKMVMARAAGESYDEANFQMSLTDAVAGVVKAQADIGIDSVNDGEFSKINFTNYVRERLGGFENRNPEAVNTYQLDMTSRDRVKFQGYFESVPPRYTRSNKGVAVCAAPLTYIGKAQLKADLENFKAATEGAGVSETYLPANTPGTIEHWMPNEYYKSEEVFLFAVADAMRVEALNYGLRNFNPEKVRVHVCWGSFHGPHYDDIPLADIIDIILSVRTKNFSIEAPNPCHEHEWNVFENAKLESMVEGAKRASAKLW